MNDNLDQAYEKFVTKVQALGVDVEKNDAALREAFLEAAGPPLPVETALSKLAKVTNQVCAITSQTGERLGTGFLIGQREVLTAHHVIRDNPSVLCSFNNISFAQGKVKTRDATAVKGNVVASKSSAADANENVSEGHFDYAVVELQTAVGNGSRGFVALDTNSIDKSDSVYIVEHPEGGPAVVFTAGSVTQEFDDAAGLTFFHSASAGNGASGAPVFNDQFELIGMHRARSLEAVEQREAVSTSVIKRELDGGA